MACSPSSPTAATGAQHDRRHVPRDVRTEAGRVGGVLLVATSPADAVAKLRGRDSIMLNAPRVVATATA